MFYVIHILCYTCHIQHFNRHTLFNVITKGIICNLIKKYAFYGIVDAVQLIKLVISLFRALRDS